MADVIPLKAVKVGANVVALAEMSAGDTISKAIVGLANVDNTPDANKSVSALQAAAIAARYGKDNFVGTVSQAGGVPTGAGMQRVDSASGTTIRWADGTQICFNYKVITGIAISTAYGSSFVSAALAAGALPATFAGNYIDATTYWSGSSAAAISANTPAGNFNSVFMQCALSVSGATVYINALAIGRWF